MGAGLGGGSADGAFTLQLLNTKFNLNISTDDLINLCSAIRQRLPLSLSSIPLALQLAVEKF
ncbi:MAG: hypothetical protein WDM90_09410 [Ferruginibacter sp.]